VDTLLISKHDSAAASRLNKPYGTAQERFELRGYEILRRRPKKASPASWSKVSKPDILATANARARAPSILKSGVSILLAKLLTLSIASWKLTPRRRRPQIQGLTKHLAVYCLIGFRGRQRPRQTDLQTVSSTGCYSLDSVRFRPAPVHVRSGRLVVEHQRGACAVEHFHSACL
jgi:hypothetical protein